MIRDQDVHFHTPDSGLSNWAETNFFGFYNAEAKLNVGVYALFRTNLGIGSTRRSKELPSEPRTT